MAKKKKELTSEELLAEALVREEDWPYSVPGNWVWTHWDTCGDLVAGNGFKPEYQGFTDYEIPFYKVGSLKHAEQSGYLFEHENTINEETRKKLKATLIPPNSILFAKIGEAIRLNRRCLNRIHCCIDNNLMAFIPYQICNFRYGYYWTCYKEFYELANSTTVPAIRKSDLQAVPFPLPPLAEQQRIVDRIESLFDKLDQAKELIQEALDSFENRKAAILHQAFTGELTKKWREVNGVGMESWSVKPLSELCTSFQYGTSKKSLTSGKVVVIRMGNLQQGEIRWNNLAYTDDEEDIEKYLLKKGDVLFNRTNSPELVGKTSVYRGEFPAIFAGYLIRLKNNDMLNGYYLNYMMNSQRAKIYCNSVKTDGVNQSNINAKKIAAFEIPHCSIPEQQEIVRILDDLFAKEQNAKDLIDLIDQIEAMKKTILGKAFRGELGTNESKEQSSYTALTHLLIC